MDSYISIFYPLSFALAIPSAALLIVMLLWLLFEEARTIIADNFAQSKQLKVWEIMISGDSEIAKFRMPRALWKQALLRKIILREIFRHAGGARKKLVALYHHLGFEHFERSMARRKYLLDKVEALSIFGYTGKLEDRPTLKEAMNDENDLIRLTAALSLIKLEAREYVQDYVNMVVNLPPAYARKLVEPLSDLGEVVLDPVMSILKKPITPEARRFIVMIAGNFNRPDVISILIQYAHNADDEIRIESARLLGNFDSYDASENLVLLLNDKLWEVRAQAARSLASSSKPFVVEPLAKALRDENYWVRFNAANSLANHGQEGVKALMTATESDDRFASEIARQTLEKLAMLPPEAPEEEEEIIENSYEDLENSDA